MKKWLLFLRLPILFGIIVLQANAAIEDGLIGYWPLNGDALDYSVNSNNGTLLAGASFVDNPTGAGKVLQSQHGPVNTGHVSVGLPAEFHTPSNVVRFTTSGALWAMFEDRQGRLNATNYQTLLGEPPALLYVSRHMPKNRLWTMVRSIENGHPSSKNTWPKSETDSLPLEGRWYHIAWTFESHHQGQPGYFRWYIDGVLSAEYNYGLQTRLTSDFRIGADHANYPSNSKIAEVRLYDRVLTAEEVAELASEARFNSAPTYPAWWGIPETDSLEADYVNGVLTEDYSPALIGQLKYMASKARDELNTQLNGVGGAGDAIDAFVDGFTSSDPEDQNVANLGQLKESVYRFYDRFAAIGFGPGSEGWPVDLILDKKGADNSPRYPWMNDVTSEAYSPALLGQLKYLHSWEFTNFDLKQVDAEVIDIQAGIYGDGVSDLWEYSQFGDLTTYNAGEDDSAPTTPINLVLQNVWEDRAELVWNSSSDTQSTIQAYQVLVDGVVESIAVSPFASLNGLMPDTSYVITVKAIDASGNISASSSPLNVTTLSSSNPSGINAQLISGFEQSAFLKEDGTLWVWGSNEYNSLGFGPSNTRHSGVSISEPFVAQGVPQFKSVSIGEQHGLGIDSAGKIYSWGYNGSGRLGHASTSTADSLNEATAIAALSNLDIIDISAARYTSAVVDDSGQVWTWGANSYSQLGRDTSGADSATPARVELSPGVYLTGVESVAAGTRLVAALKTNGEVWTWGYSDYLGLGNLSSHQLVPQKVSITNVDSIAVGKNTSVPHTLALKSDGSVWAWGSNGRGQLGTGTTRFAFTPVRVREEGGAYLSDVIAVAAGGQYSLALKSDGTVWTWGYDYQGRLGYDVLSGSSQLYAKQIPDLRAIAQIAAGDAFGLAAASDGSVHAWGLNSSGQLGDATLVDSISPQLVSGFNWKVTTKAPRMFPASAAYAERLSVYASSDESGSTRYTIDDSMPDIADSLWDSDASLDLDTAIWVRLKNFSSSDIPGDETSRYYNVGYSIFAGYYHNFVLTPERKLHSWGSNNYKQTGLPLASSRQTDVPTELSSLYDVASISAGKEHTLALLRDGSLFTWGHNGSGRLGHGTTLTSGTYNLTKPTSVASLAGVSFNSIAAGSYSSLALSDTGEVWSWGANRSGQLGRDTGGADSGVPAKVIDSDGASLDEIQAIQAGENFSVALDLDGNVWSWGRTAYLGHGGNSSKQIIPQQVPVRGVSAIRVGKKASGHTLALKSDGTVWAWGYNGYGQLGRDSTSFGYTPAPVMQEGSTLLDNVVTIAAGGYFSLALKADGTVWSWGYDYNGRLGYDVLDDMRQRVAKQITALKNIVWIDAGMGHGIAVDANGVTYTWGDNAYGQLGLSGASSEDQITPVIARVAIDTDGDTMPDWWEAIYGIDDPDADIENSGAGDGLTNLEEFLTGTDPLISDTDNDGILDGDELYADGSHGDLDGFITNPLEPDSDFDGMLDGEEISLASLDPNDPSDALDDIDGDRIPNVFEFRNGLDVELAGDLPDPLDMLIVDQMMGADYTHTTIQSALDDASLNDYTIVLVRKGIYPEYIHNDTDSPFVLLISEDSYSSSDDGALHTIIDGSLDPGGTNTYRPLVDVSGRMVISGFTLTGLRGSSYSALRVSAADSLFSHLIIRDNRIDSIGTVYVTGNNNRFERCLIANNEANSRGGLYLNSADNTLIRHSTVAFNLATGGYAHGIGVNGYDTNVRLENCIFWNAPAADLGSEIEGNLKKVVQLNSVFKNGFSGSNSSNPMLDAFGYLTASSPLTVRNAATTAVQGRDIHLELLDLAQSGLPDIGADEWIDSENGTGDSLPDWWEEQYFGQGGLNQLSVGGDYDGDGIFDEKEYLWRANPSAWDGSRNIAFSVSDVLDANAAPSISIQFETYEPQVVTVEFLSFEFDINPVEGSLGTYSSSTIHSISTSVGTGTQTVNWDGIVPATGSYHGAEIMLARVVSQETVGGTNTSVNNPLDSYIEDSYSNSLLRISYDLQSADNPGASPWLNRPGLMELGSDSLGKVLIHSAAYQNLVSHRPINSRILIDDWLPFDSNGDILDDNSKPIPRNSITNRILPEPSIVFLNQRTEIHDYSVEAYRSVPALGEVVHAVFNLNRDAKVSLALKGVNGLMYPLYFRDSGGNYTNATDLSLAAGEHGLEFFAMNYEDIPGSIKDFRGSGDPVLFDASHTRDSSPLVDQFFRVRFTVEDLRTGIQEVRWASCRIVD